jgi:class 3 adenylate cyclase
VLGIGSDLHMDYDAAGATVHLAARMEQMARQRHTIDPYQQPSLLVALCTCRNSVLFQRRLHRTRNDI